MAAKEIGSLKVKISADTKDVTKGLDDVATKLKATEKDAKKASKGLAGLGRGAGQAGIQIQQFVGQIQGGQNAMLALSQQGADMGIVLGAPLVGAVVGIGASLIGMAMAANTTKNAVSELDKISEALGKTLTESADGADVLSDRILKLAKVSESLARIEISKGIIDSEKKIKASIEGIKNAVDGIDLGVIGEGFEAAQIKTGKSVDEILKSTKRLGDLGGTFFRGLESSVNKLHSQFDITRDQAAKLGVALAKVDKDASPINIKTLQNALEDLNQETGGANKKVVEFASNLTPLFMGLREGVDSANLLKLAFTDLGNAVKDSGGEVLKNQKAIDSIIDGLQLESDMLGKNATERIIHLAGLKDATQAEKDLIKVLSDRIQEEAAANKKGGSGVDRLSRETQHLKTQLELQNSVKNEAITADEARAVSAFNKQLERSQSMLDTELAVAGDNEELRAALKAEFTEQQIIAAEIVEGRLTEAARIGVDARIAEAEREANLKRRMQNAELSAVTRFATSSLKLLSAFGSQSFKTQKKFAIADSLINIASGVAKALNNPFPANLGFAASVAASGAALIGTLRSTNPGGGGKVPSISGGGGSASGVGGSALSENLPESRNISINLTGEGLMSTAQVRELIGQINESVGDGVQLITSGES